MRMTIIGSGYVGLVTGTCLAETRNTVCAWTPTHRTSNSSSRTTFPSRARAGIAGRQERRRGAPNVHDRSAGGCAPHESACSPSGTPRGANGEADLSAVEDAARAIGATMDGPKVIVTQSTVPAGTTPYGIGV